MHGTGEGVHPSPGLLHHSDRGSQYCSRAYQHLREQSGMMVSMSRKGNCWENAAMESFFGSLKQAIGTLRKRGRVRSVLHQRLIKTGTTPTQTPVVLEATGVSWLSFAPFFSRQGYAGSCVNPMQVHHFARVLRQPCENGCHRRDIRWPNWLRVATIYLAALAACIKQQARETHQVVS
jgi:hypothetical protein